MKLNIQNETSRLKSVILGIAESIGPVPSKSVQHIKAGTYPKESDMVKEMEAVAAVFKKYDVKVYRPKVIKDYNQIFSRDIAFVIEDKLIEANILPDREREYEAIQHVLDEIGRRILLYCQKNAT